jgi:hypothetical protein
VVAALAQLDLCALLTPPPAETGIDSGTKPIARGPHYCTISRGDGQDDVRASVLGSYDSGQRFDNRPLNLDGVKAYLLSRWESRGTCTARIPVSFRMAVVLEVSKGSRSGSTNLCDQVRAVARSAAVKLRNPDSARANPQVTPLVNWPACAALAAGLGTDAQRYTLGYDAGVSESVDSCHGSDKELQGDSEVTLRLAYQGPLTRQDVRTLSIGGKTVQIVEGGEPCRLTWSNGPSKSTSPGATDQIIALRAPNCAQGESVATNLITALAGNPPAGPAPQRPLVYGVDEPDVPYPGACADAPNPKQCEPYHEAEVPSGGTLRVVGAALEDPNVNCAVATAAVRKHLGDGFSPVTSGDRCRFVQQSHATIFSLELRHAGITTGCVGKATESQIAGRRAYTCDHTTQDGGSVEIAVDLGTTDSGQAASAYASLDFARPRDAANTEKPDTGKAALLQPLVTDIVSQYLVS